MAEFDMGICIPFLGLIALMVAAATTYVLKVHRSSSGIPRTRNEMNRMARQKEDTYIVDINHGILGKQVSVPISEANGYLNVDWSPIGNFSGKKLPLPQPLPTFCFDIPPLDLAPACGVGKKLQIVLPYNKETKMVFLRPYIQQIHELKIRNAEIKRFYDEMLSILRATTYVPDAMELIEDLERRRKPWRSSTLLNTEQQPPPQPQPTNNVDKEDSG